MDKRTVNRNLRLLQAIRCTSGAFVLFPVYAVFYQSKGLNQTEIFLLGALYSITAAVLEIPSGWFADHYGHKRSIVVSCVTITVAFSLYYVGQGFFWLLVAELFVGISYGFRSGAGSALAMESLKTIGEEDRCLAFETNAQIYTTIGGIVSAMAGGFVAAWWGLELVIIVQAFVALCSILLAYWLKEAPRIGENESQPEGDQRKSGDVKRALAFAFFAHPRFKWYMGATALIGGLLPAGYWLSQPYYQVTGIPVGWFGFLGACYLGAVCLFAFLFCFFQHVSPQAILTASVVALVVGFALLGAGMSVWAIPALLGVCFVSAVAYPTLTNQLNQAITDPTIRATVLSVRALVMRLGTALVTPVVGRITDVYSLQTALLSTAVIGAVFGAFIVVGLLKTAKVVIAS